MTVKIGIAGVGGRMGRALVKAAEGRADSEIIGGFEHPDHQDIGKPIDRGGRFRIEGEAAPIFEAADVVVDFTRPEALERHLDLAGAHRAALVVGTTGLTSSHHDLIEKAARSVAIVQSANMSLGVNLLAKLVGDAARALDDAWDVEILDLHHRHKVDAPSGTALLLGEAVAKARNVVLDDFRESGRDGIGEPRRRGAIGFAALRGGTAAGEHSVIFLGDDERVELTHKATDRAIFARGALAAARWVKHRAAGRYAMADVLGVASNK